MDDNNLSQFLIKKLVSLRSKKKTKYQQPILSFYKGTTTSDMILANDNIRLKLKHFCLEKNPKHQPFAFIVNTVHSGASTVGHWMGLVVHSQKNKIIVRFFDSLGQPYTSYKTIAGYIHRIKDKCNQHHLFFVLDTMRRAIQHHDSKVCGLYVAYFITKVYECDNTKWLRELFGKFKNDRKANDLRMQRFLLDNYPGDYCHDTPVYFNRKATLWQLATHKVSPPLCPKRTLGFNHCSKKCKCSRC